MSTFQLKQIDFLEQMMQLEKKRTSRTYFCHCKECQKEERYHTPDMALRFLNNHENHHTWVQTA